MKRLLLTAVLTTLPYAALAETQLERLERISEAMTEMMFDAMVDMVEKEGGNPEPLRAAIPDVAWNDAYREAGDCLLDRLIAASSESAIDDMLSEMDAALPQMAEMDAEAIGEDMDFMPDGISDDYMIDANSECGLVDLSLQRMQDSGFTEAMMQSMAEN